MVLLGSAFSLRGWGDMLAQAAADAPTLRIQLLSGKTGRPVANQRLTLTRGDGKSLDGSPRNRFATTDGEGYAAIPNLDATVGNVLVAVDFFKPCSKTGKRAFSLVAVRASGVVSENVCRPRITVFPQAGTLIFFVRPETWLEKNRR